MHAINRRAFLALGLGAAAWSCARPKKKASPGDTQISIAVTAQVGMAAGDTRNGILPSVALKSATQTHGVGAQPSDVIATAEVYLQWLRTA